MRVECEAALVKRGSTYGAQRVSLGAKLVPAPAATPADCAESLSAPPAVSDDDVATRWVAFCTPEPPNGNRLRGEEDAPPPRPFWEEEGESARRRDATSTEKRLACKVYRPNDTYPYVLYTIMTNYFR